MSRLVTIGEAARALGVSPRTLRRYEEHGLLKPIRTMGGQRRYYLSALRELLRDAEEPTPNDIDVTSDSSEPAARGPSAWDEVEREKASFEAVKIRSQRADYLRDRSEAAAEAQKARATQAQAALRESNARALREQADLERERSVKAHESNLQYHLTLGELSLRKEPEEAQSAIRRALLALLTSQRIPVGTPSYRIMQLVSDEINAAAAPFRRVRELRAKGSVCAQRQLADSDLDYATRTRLRDAVEAELMARVTAEWTPRKVERVVDATLDDMWPSEDA